MKFGIAGWSLTNFALNDEFKMVDYAKKFGYESIDLSLEGKNYDFMNKPFKEVKKHYLSLKEYADQNGIIFYQVHASFTAFPNYLYNEYFEKIVKTIKIASLLNCPYVVMHPLVFPINKDINMDEKEKKFNMDFFNKLIPYLKKYNVKLCLENIYDWYNKQIEMVYVSHPKNLKDYVDTLNSEYIGICLDTGHMHLAKENMYDAIKIFESKLWTLHIHDCYQIKDDHFLIYDGTINWQDVKKALEEINYKGVFNLEIKPISSEESYYKKALLDAKALINK